mmetsp:Transcript_5974/g.6709  ORF Transcript_5974/g.6709 Transcript_5974/m.6709 type:complete len:596 (-) Transcript_5974:116-1903(-)
MVIANSNSNTTLVSIDEIDDKKKKKNNNNNKHIDVVIDETGLLRYVEAATETNVTSRCNDSEGGSFHDDDDDDDCSCCGGYPTGLLISMQQPTTESESKGKGLQQSPSFVPLYLPLEGNHQKGQKQQTSSSSSSFNDNIDEYLSHNYYTNNTDNNRNWLQVPGSNVLKESRDRLLGLKKNGSICTNSTPIRFFGDSSKQQQPQPHRLLYVAQGERGNTTTQQYDVIMSDKATTCHVLAFHSNVNNNDNDNDNNNNLPLTSLTHLDGPHYDGCVREMIKEHIDHHHHQQSIYQGNKINITEETKCDNGNDNNNKLRDIITIEIHIVGGFNDDDDSSSTITDWLLQLLAQIAEEYKYEPVRMIIKTLVVSSSNNQQLEIDDTNNDNDNNRITINSPIGRGLGIDVSTGEVFLAKCNSSNGRAGPVPTLRSVRLWSRGGEGDASSHQSPQQHRLSVVHTIKDINNLWSSFNVDFNDKIRNEYSLFLVQPFQFRSTIPDIDSLLRLPDEILLQYTSTSPDVEEEGFCNDVRASLQFLQQRSCEKDDGQKTFGTNLNQPIVFAKKIMQQQWKQLSTECLADSRNNKKKKKHITHISCTHT